MQDRHYRQKDTMIRSALAMEHEEQETGEDTEESASETGHLGESALSPIGMYSQNRHTLFANNRNKTTAWQLRPELSPEDKELLAAFLKELGLNFDEFKLKLNDLKMSVKDFTKTLKENLSALGIKSPKESAEFIEELSSRGLLHETFLEKHNAKKLLLTEEAKTLEPSLRTPFNMRPRPFGR